MTEHRDGAQTVDSRRMARHAERQMVVTKRLETISTSSRGRITIIQGDARDIPLPDASVDLVVTSPPYWRKRDYGIENQIGQEATPDEYVMEIRRALTEWNRVLRPTGSVFLNIGDTYWRRSLAGIPGRIEQSAVADGWTLRNRVIWAKTGGMPEPARDRLANRHEYVLHLAKKRGYYYDLFGYSRDFGNGANPGDVWTFAPSRSMGAHLAPFPPEIVHRAVTLACPEQVCSVCRIPRQRMLRRTADLDPSRPQARRAAEIAREAGLTEAHIAAIQATGVSDVGKATRIQTGTGKNSERVKTLAAEAKIVLGGYFREYTFARREQVGWSDCGHNAYVPGVVLDPFAGTGTSLHAAVSLGRDAIGVDLVPVASTSFNSPGEPIALGGDGQPQ